MKLPTLTTFNPNYIDDIFVDLDGVTADFEDEQKKTPHEPDIFKRMPGSYIWLPPIKDALDAIQFLEKAAPGRVWFLTKPPKHSPYAYVEKALWTQRYFGDEGLHRLIVTQDKSLMGTENSIIVDDRPHKANVPKFRGTVMHFGSPSCIDWEQTLRNICILHAVRQKSREASVQPT